MHSFLIILLFSCLVLGLGLESEQPRKTLSVCFLDEEGHVGACRYSFLEYLPSVFLSLRHRYPGS